MPPRPDQRPGGGTSLGDHEKRIRALERHGTVMRPIVFFDFLGPSQNLAGVTVNETFWGTTRATSRHGGNHALTTACVAVIGDRVRLGYSNNGPGILLLGAGTIQILNFTTGQVETCDSTTIAVPDGGGGLLSFDAHQGGPVLLDRTIPDQPAFNVAGNYIIIFNLQVGWP